MKLQQVSLARHIEPPWSGTDKAPAAKRPERVKAGHVKTRRAQQDTKVDKYASAR